jgi:ribosomal protein S18 acetylase RimI-like enzyme
LKDADTIARLWLEFMKEHRKMGSKYGEDLIPDVKEDAPWGVEEYYRRNIRSGNGLLLVIDEEGDIGGFMLCQVMKNIPIFVKEKVGYLSSVYIKPGFRGMGYSSEMFRRSMEWFEQKGITEISLNVMYCNPNAKEVYRSWGFKDIHSHMRLDLD